MLSLTRALIALRREAEDLRTGSYRTLDAPDGVWAWRRGAGHFVVLNMTDELAVVSGLDGTLRISTERPRDGELVAGEVDVAPWEGVIGVAQAPGDHSPLTSTKGVVQGGPSATEICGGRRSSVP